jgi:class 3 adenylate cyclase/tetratricopeptide (TPR) repeat protein
LTVCGACGGHTPAGKRFCVLCGETILQSCPACGEPVLAGSRFCAECGASLTGATAASLAAPAAAPATVSERRLVSVLFADLVGFTALSERRDPEEVRELLSTYFDRSRSLIELYGGTVEKFIGDAVMAVWGSPVAREDDAERAVRAALGLTQAVGALGEEVGIPELKLRAGVLTGRAAVERGAEAEGMVIGDTVNTASRLQSLATPGTVLVDDVTRRASEAAIAYEDAGVHEVKGRGEPVRAWTALRVVAGRGGVGRTAGLEAPFVGRERELERLIAASEQSAATGRSDLVAVVGDAGTGKSRLLWEYSKFIDGVESRVYWHQGRCLAYGEGVGFWALAEMVRARAGIAEEEEPGTARAKLDEVVAQHVSDEREQRLVAPRLARLLGLEHGSAADRADLFSGWRLFFERLAATNPVILAFEDMQWADSGLLDFIDYLLEWSGEHPIMVFVLGRPELLESRAAWASRSVVLGEVSEEAMRTLLSGLAPGLPEELVTRIVRRAEGVPLYAVETVRMLLDRGLLRQDGPRYAVAAEIGELEVPETLHALAAARLDALTAMESAVLEDASIYGQAFTTAGVAALGKLSQGEVREVLDGLVNKQVLGFDDDPLSAERGQYHFLQALLRTTAYETLSRRDRKERHLAAARHLQESWGGGTHEIAEVLAAHFVDAADVEPDAPDAPQIREMAADTLAEAGRRALSLALGREAQSAFERAADLTGDATTRAMLLEQAGRAGFLNAEYPASRARLEQAVSLYDERGDRESVARCLATIAQVLGAEDRIEDAIELNRRAVEGLPEGGRDKAAALAALSRNLVMRGKFDEGFAAADAALAIAEPLEDWHTIVNGLQTIAIARLRQVRLQEASALFEKALTVAVEHDLSDAALRGYNNLGNIPLQNDHFSDALVIAEQGIGLARARGDRHWESMLVLLATTAHVAIGNWDDLPAPGADGLPAVAGLLRIAYLSVFARVHAGRGELSALERILELAPAAAATANTEFAAGPSVARAIALNALGRHAEALDAGLPIVLGASDIVNEDRREAYFEAATAALELDDEATIEQLIRFVRELPPAARSPLIRAGAARLEGLVAWRRGDVSGADSLLIDAAHELAAVDARFFLAQVLLERAEILLATSRADEAEPLLAEARSIFVRLRAAPWLERLDSRVASQAVA